MSKRTMIIAAVVIIAFIAALMSVKYDFAVEISTENDDMDPEPDPVKDPTLNHYQGFIKGYKWNKVSKQYDKIETEIIEPEPENLTDKLPIDDE